MRLVLVLNLDYLEKYTLTNVDECSFWFQNSFSCFISFCFVLFARLRLDFQCFIFVPQTGPFDRNKRFTNREG